jgi:hypothetical protein
MFKLPSTFANKKNAIMVHQNKNKKFVEKINSHTSLLVDANQ